MQLVNREQFLNTTSLFVLFAYASVADISGMVIVLLTTMYALLKSHKLDFNIIVLNLI